MTMDGFVDDEKAPVSKEQSPSALPEAPLTRPTQLATPWRRYWARLLDLTFFSLLIGFTIGLAFPSLFSPDGALGGPGTDHLVGWLLLPLVMIFDGVILGLFGTTLGKAIAGVHVSGLRGEKLRVGDAIQRNFQMWWYGLGTGFPIVSFFTLISSYRRASRGDQMKWEVSTGARSYARQGATRTVVTAVACIALYVGLATIDGYNSTFGSNSQRPFSQPTDDDAEWWERELQAAVGEVNRSAPLLVDEITRLDGANAGPGKALTYRFTLLETDADVIPPGALQEFNTVMSETLRSDNCGDSDVRDLLKSGVRLVYTYNDSYGQLVTELEIGSRDCLP